MATKLADPQLPDAPQAVPRLAAGRWRAKPYAYADARRLVTELGVSPTLAAILVRRGYATPASAGRFLAADEVHDPFEMRGLEAAAGLLLRSAESGKRITVHGDYDADGVCATALTVRALRALGASVNWFLPSRFDEGYGIARETVERLAGQGTDVLLAVDCGITAVEEVECARERGLEVVIADHHRPGERVPECAIVHPALGGYPCPHLCGTAVAFKLAQGVARLANRDPALPDEDLDLVALATVADVVELVGENRALLRRGLKALASTAKPGLRALMQVAQVEPGDISAQAIGFRLAPRINAAGRLYRADAGVELLLTEDGARAAEIARELDRINHERRDEGRRVLIEAEAALRALPSADREAYALVVAGAGWHQGVIGITAGRLAERYRRPAVVIAVDGAVGRGSGRSIPAYDLHAGLTVCASHLRQFGGHRQAAGLEIDADAIDDFRGALAGHAAAALRPEDLEPVEEIDAVVPGDALGLELAEELERLEPCGQGNPAATLLVPWARLEDVRPMGDGKHVRFRVVSGGVSAQGVGFGTGPKLPLGDATNHDVSFKLESNRWNGAVEPRLVLKTIYPVGVAARDGGPVGTPEEIHTDCTCCASDDDWWRAVMAETSRQLAEGAEDERFELNDLAERRAGRTVVDWRGRGALGVLGELMTTGERLLIVCANVSRRRALLHDQLGSQVAMIGYESIAALTERLPEFTHIALVDPPAFAGGAEAVLRGAPDGFAHLVFGASECEFATRVLEQNWELRAPCAAIYRAIGAGARNSEAPGAGTRELLAGSGEHPRSAQLVGRALRVLSEVGLVRFDETASAVELCGQGPPAGDAVDLHSSAAYRSYMQRYEVGAANIRAAL